jgi:c-di-GMP-binding flagellar brake protein YcgR
LGLKDLLFKKKEPSEILVDHFKMVKSEDTELTVTLDGVSRRYASRLFGLSQKEKRYNGLLIDTLIPANGNEIITGSKSIKLKYKFRGANYTFWSKYLGLKKGKFEALRISIPEKIIKTGGKKHQRDSYRAMTSMIDPCFVIINNREDKLIDISTGGFSFLTVRSLEHFWIDKTPLPVTVSIPSQKISFDADVRICHYVTGAYKNKQVTKNKTAVQFLTKLRFNEEEAIAQYVMERQRESLQKTNSEEA